jgi:hypothetical protein
MLHSAEQRHEQALVNSLMREAFVRAWFWALGYNSFHAVRLSNKALQMINASAFRLRGTFRLSLIRLGGLYGLAQLIFIWIPALSVSLFMAITGK